MHFTTCVSYLLGFYFIGAAAAAAPDPTGEPSGQPTAEPSGEPSGLPSSHPTYAYPLGTHSFSGGGNNTTPVMWSVDGLGFVNRGGGALYLTVDVWPTHFEVQGLQYVTVKVNGIVIDQYCTPDEECGNEFHSCFYDMDVQSYIQEPLGGVLAIEVSSPGVPSTVCDHSGYSLYTRMFLREALPTGQPTAEPSGQPSGEPSGRPTREPSGQPSSHPSSEPSAQPTSQPSGQPSEQPSHQPSGEPTSKPTGQPTDIPSGQPSGEPSGCPSGEPSSEPSSPPTGEPSAEPSGIPTAQPSDQPTDQPTGEPTGEPSGQPSGEPTGEPSGQPSSHPTLLYPLSLSFAGGGNDSHSVVWESNSLGFASDVMPLYLSVEVYPTDYEIMANQYATIKVNGNTVKAYCTPDESCGSVWFSCVSEYDVQSLKSESLGGSLVVEVSSVGLSSGPCNYLGHPLYARMFLREALPTGEPSTQPSGEPSGQPSLQPSGEPTDVPTGQPTNIPSGQPSGEPSGCPSGEPSGAPSVQPTANPTTLFPHSLETEKGGDNDHPVVFALNNLGFVDREVPLYLTVSVAVTDYLADASKWATVKVNGRVVAPFCTPQAHCSGAWHNCVFQQDVTQLLNASNGGSLEVEVSTVNVVSGLCDFAGYPLYARVLLTEIPPSEEESFSINIFFGAGVGFFLLLLCVLFMTVWHRRRSARVYIQYEGNSRDFCLENEDVENTKGIDITLEPPSVAPPITNNDKFDIESIN